MSAGEALLRVEDLHVEFPSEDGIVHAVDGITYQVLHGKTLGIVGESGSGKTVASLTTLGLTRRMGARISGDPVPEDPPAATFADAVAAQEVLDAIQLSSAERRPVDVGAAL